MFGPDFNQALVKELSQFYAETLRIIHKAVHHLPNISAHLSTTASQHAVRSGANDCGNFLDTALGLHPWNQGLLLWTINKDFSDPALRTHVAHSIARFVTSQANFILAPQKTAAEEFLREGITYMPNLVAPSEAREMLGYFEACGDRVEQDSVLHHHIADVVRAPYAFRVATDERVLAVARQQIGASPTAVQMDAWWSTPPKGEPSGLQVFHRDRDDFRACKLFLYLSDVTADNGPHIFVRKSHQYEVVTDLVAGKALPADVAGKLFLGNTRSLAPMIDEIFGDAVTEITGPAGTAFIENTYGLHRGKIPVTGNRCIFQVTYAAVPYPARVKRWRAANLDKLPECITSPRDRWTMRLALAGSQDPQIDIE